MKKKITVVLATLIGSIALSFPSYATMDERLAIVQPEIVKQEAKRKMGTYSLEELEAYFGHDAEVRKNAEKDPYLREEISKHFPDIVHRFYQDSKGIYRLSYSVCNVEEGGRYFIFPYVNGLVSKEYKIFSRREDIYPGERDLIECVGVHLTKLPDWEDFIGIRYHQTMYEDLWKIDSYNERLLGSVTYSFSLLSDGTMLYFGYSHYNPTQEEIEQNESGELKKWFNGLRWVMTDVEYITERDKKTGLYSSGAAGMIWGKIKEQDMEMFLTERPKTEAERREKNKQKERWIRFMELDDFIRSMLFREENMFYI